MALMDFLGNAATMASPFGFNTRGFANMVLPQLAPKASGVMPGIARGIGGFARDTQPGQVATTLINKMHENPWGRNTPRPPGVPRLNNSGYQGTITKQQEAQNAYDPPGPSPLPPSPGSQFSPSQAPQMGDYWAAAPGGPQGMANPNPYRFMTGDSMGGQFTRPTQGDEFQGRANQLDRRWDDNYKAQRGDHMAMPAEGEHVEFDALQNNEPGSQVLDDYTPPPRVDDMDGFIQYPDPDRPATPAYQTDEDTLNYRPNVGNAPGKRGFYDRKHALENDPKYAEAEFQRGLEDARSRNREFMEKGGGDSFMERHPNTSVTMTPEGKIVVRGRGPRPAVTASDLKRRSQVLSPELRTQLQGAMSADPEQRAQMGLDPRVESIVADADKFNAFQDRFGRDYKFSGNFMPRTERRRMDRMERMSRMNRARAQAMGAGASALRQTLGG